MFPLPLPHTRVESAWVRSLSNLSLLHFNRAKWRREFELITLLSQFVSEPGLHHSLQLSTIRCHYFTLSVPLSFLNLTLWFQTPSLPYCSNLLFIRPELIFSHECCTFLCRCDKSGASEWCRMDRSGELMLLVPHLIFTDIMQVEQMHKSELALSFQAYPPSPVPLHWKD